MPSQDTMNAAYAYIAFMALKYCWDEIECNWDPVTGFFAVSYVQRIEDYVRFRPGDIPPLSMTEEYLKEGVFDYA